MQDDRKRNRCDYTKMIPAGGCNTFQELKRTSHTEPPRVPTRHGEWECTYFNELKNNGTVIRGESANVKLTKDFAATTKATGMPCLDTAIVGAKRASLELDDHLVQATTSISSSNVPHVISLPDMCNTVDDQDKLKCLHESFDTLG